MEHIFFFDGNQEGISWVIKNENTNLEQFRDHPDIYRDKVSPMQAKYIALHVGIFWCIGRFIIKNGDTVKAIIDSEIMFRHLADNEKSPDSFIETKTEFLRQLITQRNLNVKYEMIESDQNIATHLLFRK